MAPRMMPPTRSNPTARTFTTNPAGIVHTSKMFKNYVPTARSRAAPPTKYDLTSKPHGITKTRLQGRTSATLRARIEKPGHPLTALFADTSKDYRRTVVNEAQASLVSTRRALVDRLTAPYRPQHDAEDEKRAPDLQDISSSPTPYRPQSPPNRLPTAAELKDAHNAAVAAVTAPLGDTVVMVANAIGDEFELDDQGRKVAKEKTAEGREPHADAQQQQQRRRLLSTQMADFAAVVAREEKELRELGELWMQTQVELRLLAEVVFGKTVVQGMMRGKADETVVEEVAKGLAEEEVEALRRAVEEMAEEEGAKADEVRDGEKRVRREQRRTMMATVRKMEEL